jgi:hypothetical protein
MVEVEGEELVGEFRFKYDQDHKPGLIGPGRGRVTAAARSPLLHRNWQIECIPSLRSRMLLSGRVLIFGA